MDNFLVTSFLLYHTYYTTLSHLLSISGSCILESFTTKISYAIFTPMKHTMPFVCYPNSTSWLA